MHGKRLFTWSSIFMIITGVIHLIGHFAPPDLSTKEKQEMYDSMHALQFQIDPMFSRTVMDFFNMFSLSLTVLIVSLGAVNYLVAKKTDSNALFRSLSLISLVGMLAMLFLSFKYAFSVPIGLFTILVVGFLLSYLKLNSEIKIEA